MSNEFYSNHYIKIKQLILLCFSTVFVLVLIFVSIDYNTITYWSLTLAVTSISILLNTILGRVSDVRINKENIVFENLYLTDVKYNVDEFMGIENTYSFIPLFNPFVSPPYYTLALKNGKKFIFYDASMLSFTSIFKKERYSKVLEDRIRRIIGG